MTLRKPVTLPRVLGVTAITLVVGYALKQACFLPGLASSYSFYCHSDFVPVYSARDLAGGRFPYAEPALEYPVGLGSIIWAISLVSPSAVAFWLVNVYVASIAALITSWLLWREAGHRALFFAAAPSLALYAFLNWDLIAVVCAVAATAAFLRRRDVTAALVLAIGVVVKIFPGLLLVPFVADRIRQGNSRSARRLIIVAVGVIAALNLPFALLAFDGWRHFFLFSSARVPDWGSTWSVSCHSFGWPCDNVVLVNTLSLATFIAGSLLVWFFTTRAAPRMPRWQLAFPLVVVFLLTNKVFSPQHSLWILPWFALALPDVRLFLAYQAIDVGLYITTFAWQQQLAGFPGLPMWPQNVFVVLRAAILVTMLVVFARRARTQIPH